MAQSLNTLYGSRAPVNAPDFPNGEPIDAVGAGTGFPLQKDWPSEIFGFFEALLAEPPAAGPDGNPETAQASQYLEKMKLLFGNASLPQWHMSGLQKTVNVGTDEVTIQPGEARNFAHTVDLRVTSAITKDFGSTFAVGSGNGGTPDAFTAMPPDGWYRLFLVAQPDGTPDLTIDTSATAANFFADAVAAPVFTDTSLYRRIGWVYVTGGAFRLFLNDPDDPTRYLWDNPTPDFSKSGAIIGTGSRYAMGFQLPPSTRALLTAEIDCETTSGGYYALFTEEDQTGAAGVTDWDVRFDSIYLDPGQYKAELWLDLRLNTSSEAYVSLAVTSGAVADFKRVAVNSRGWVDHGVIA